MRKITAMFTALVLFLCAAAGYAEDDLDELLIEETIEYVEPEATPSLYESDGSTLITVTCTGDFTIGGDNYHHKNIFEKELEAQDGDINFTMRNVRDILMNDDMTLINFEGTFTETTYVPDKKKNNDYLFNAPPSYVSMLTDNGIEAAALENNHVMDHGQEGFDDTMQTLRDAGIIYSNSEEMGVFEVKDIQIAMLSYLCIDRYQTLWDKVPEDIKAAKEKYPIVIVSFHWGKELDYTPNENQIKMGRLAVDSGADLVIGNHSHRINPIEEYKGVYICYSLGNFCFAGNTKPSDMNSYLFQVRFKVKDGVASTKAFRIIPIKISSRKDRNDFIPTVITEDVNIDGIINTLKENGRKLEYAVSEYPLEWE